MTDLFRPMPKAEREAYARDYVQAMRARDGAPDPETRTLETRERFFREQVEGQPVRWEGTPLVDPEVFARNLDRHRPEEGLDTATLWALASAKINRGERYGVELGLRLRGPMALDPEDPHTWQELQELYHTRILRDVVETLGLKMSMSPPRLSLKLLIGAMTRLPKPIANVVIFLAELIGATVFGRMLERGRELFASQPAVLDRIETLYGQILADEIGHVRLMRGTLGPAQLAVARALVRPMARRMVRDVPEVDRLFGRREIARSVARVTLADLDGWAPAAA